MNLLCLVRGNNCTITQCKISWRHRDWYLDLFLFSYLSLWFHFFFCTCRRSCQYFSRMVRCVSIQSLMRRYFLQSVLRGWCRRTSTLSRWFTTRKGYICDLKLFLAWTLSFTSSWQYSRFSNISVLLVQAFLSLNCICYFLRVSACSWFLSLSINVNDTVIIFSWLWCHLFYLFVQARSETHFWFSIPF